MDIREKKEKLRIIHQDGGEQENLLEILLDIQFASAEGYIDEETAAVRSGNVPGGNALL